MSGDAGSAAAALTPEEASIEAAAKDILEEIALRGVGALTADIDRAVAVLAADLQVNERHGWYEEAAIVDQILRQLRAAAEDRHLTAMALQQELVRAGVDDAHDSEFREFTRAWGERLAAHDAAAADAEARKLAEHSAQLEALHVGSGGARGVPSSPRRGRSKTLLALRHAEAQLARQKAYAEAAKAREKADKLEAEETARDARERASDAARQEAQLLLRQRDELSALRARNGRLRAVLERRQREELAVLVQRYANARRGLAAQQAVQKARTSTLLRKHTGNPRATMSGAAAIAQAVRGGVYGAAPPRAASAGS